MLRAVVCLIATLGSVAQVRAQDGPAHEVVEVRVTASGPGATVQIDRGTSDRLEVGDRVLFRPRDGGEVRGRVTRLEERVGVVELSDKGVALAAGTRGEVLVPTSRLPAPVAQQPPSEPPVEHPPWENADEEWSEDMPLLAQVRAVLPEDRARQVNGRVYLIADQTLTSDKDRSDRFIRTGADVTLENAFGKGGALEVDFELNQRTVDLPDDDGEDHGRLRVDRLSYSWGGTRFSDVRWQVGRFLQHGLPELGVLDGFEYARRQENGHAWGASVGFMPEPDEQSESGHDSQVAGWYHWVSDESERFSVDAGFQKTFHDGAADRSLLLTRVRWLPPEGWDFHGTTWVDFYGGDSNKGKGPELTQARLSSSRRFGERGGLDVTFQHISFPDIDRKEFAPPIAESLADARNDRLALSGWSRLGRKARVHSTAGGWVDEDETGGDAALGLEVEDVLGDAGRADVTGFLTQGRFSLVYGGRVTYGRSTRLGRWDAFYELADHHLDGRDADTDDLLQHRLGLNHSLHTAGGWSFAWHLAANLWDSDGSYGGGLFLQKSF